MAEWILASASISRRYLLDSIRFPYTSVPADIDENAIQAMHGRLTPAQISLFLAQKKAQTVSLKHPEALVIGSDQVLDCAGELMRKPENVQQASEALHFLQGRRHRLTASVAVYANSKSIFHAIDTADMHMRVMSQSQISNYLSQYWSVVSGTVGAYRVEAEGFSLFDSIRGQHATVLGFPLAALMGFVRRFDLLGSDPHEPKV